MLGRALFSPHRRLWHQQAVRIWSHHLASLPNPSPSLEPDPTTSTAARSTNDDDVRDPAVTLSEAKRLMRLVNVEALKKKLGETGGEVIAYNELLRTCQSMGVARSSDEAAAFARALDDSSVVLLFRDKVYLHPDKVVDSVRKAVPFVLASENDPRKDELKQLVIKKEEIDKLAHKQVRRILWTGLAGLIAQVGLFFRLTFWEFSWDVMEPIAFFTTTTGLVVGYAYFLITSRDPTYQDFMERLFTTRQKKLMQKHGFNMERYLELQKCCKDPWEKICRENHHPGTDGSHQITMIFLFTSESRKGSALEPCKSEFYQMLG